MKCNFSYINLVTFESLFNDKRQNYLTLVCRLLKSIYYCVRKRKQAVYHPSSRGHSIGAVWCHLAVVLAIKVTTSLSSSKLEAKKWWLEFHREGDKGSENNRIWWIFFCSRVTDLAATFQWSSHWILQSQKICLKQVLRSHLLFQPLFEANVCCVQVLPNSYLSNPTLKPLRTKIQKSTLLFYH